MPRISVTVDKEVGEILAKPLVWAAFDELWAEKVHDSICIRIVSEYLRLERELQGNPIRRVEVIPNEGSRYFGCSPQFVPLLDQFHELTKLVLGYGLNSGWNRQPRRDD